MPKPKKPNARHASPGANQPQDATPEPQAPPAAPQEAPRVSQRAQCEARGVNTFFEGHDNAIIGTAERRVVPDRQVLLVAVYDEMEIMSNLILQGMTEAQAEEHYKTRIAGAWYALATPIIIEPLKSWGISRLNLDSRL